jgi:tripeptidyl-peptidase-1
MDMRIGLKQNKVEELISSLYEVSDPAHARYGAHLSTEQVQALVAPHRDSVELVDSWLTHHDIDLSSAHRSGGNDWISLRVSVAQAERLLGGTVFLRIMSNFLKFRVHRHQIQCLSPLKDL